MSSLPKHAWRLIAALTVLLVFWLGGGLSLSRRLVQSTGSFQTSAGLVAEITLLGACGITLSYALPFAMHVFFMLRGNWRVLGPRYRGHRRLMRKASWLSINRPWVLLTRFATLQLLVISLLAYVLFLDVRLLGFVVLLGTLVVWAHLRLSLPVAVMLLGASGQGTIRLQERLKILASPRRVASLLDFKHAAPGHHTVGLELDCFRTENDDDWWRICTDILAQTPVLVLDGRTASEVVAREVDYIVRSGLTTRCLFVGFRGDSCAILDDVLAKSPELQEVIRRSCLVVSEEDAARIVRDLLKRARGWPLTAQFAVTNSISRDETTSLQALQPNDEEIVALVTRLELAGAQLLRHIRAGSLDSSAAIVPQVSSLIVELQLRRQSALTLHAVARAWLLVAELDSARGAEQEAAEHVERALTSLRAINGDLDGLPANLPLTRVRALARRARIALSSSGPESALAAAREAAERADALEAGACDTCEVAHFQSLAHIAHGDVQLQLKQLRGARQAFEKSLRALSTVSQSSTELEHNHELLRDFAASHSRLGNVLLNEGQTDEALQQHVTALQWAERAVAAAPKRPDLVRDYAVGHAKVALARGLLTDFTGALAGYERAIQLLREILEQDPQRPEWNVDLAMDLGTRGVIMMDLEDESNAMKSFAEAAELFDALRQRGQFPRSAASMEQVCQQYLSGFTLAG